MADLVITESNVKPGGTDSRLIPVQLGETCLGGEEVYRNTSDSKYYRADNSASNKADVEGTLITGGLINDYAVLCYEGPVIIGPTTPAMVKGESYMAADNPGKLMPIADLTTGDLETFCGYGISTTVLQVAPNATGVVN